MVQLAYGFDGFLEVDGCHTDEAVGMGLDEFCDGLVADEPFAGPAPRAQHELLDPAGIHELDELIRRYPLVEERRAA